MDAATSRVDLLDEGHAAVGGLGGLRVEGASVHVGLTNLDPGAYTVAYQVTSALDGHVTVGQFTFLIDPTGILPPPTAPAESSSPSGSLDATLARWLSLIAALGLIGLALFWLLSAAPLLGDRHRGAPWGSLAMAGVTAFVGLAIYLALAARPLAAGAVHGALVGHAPGPGHTGFPLDFAAPFGWTPFAIAMRVAMAGAAAAFIIATARHFAGSERQRRGDRAVAGREGGWLVAVAAAGAISLGGSSLAGHAAAGGLVLAGLDWLHLLGSAAWIGTLPGVLLLARRVRADPERGTILKAALRSHARLALVAAPVVALTGLLTSPAVLGEERELVASAYGNFLLAKGLLFALAIALAAAAFAMSRRRGIGRPFALVGAPVGVGALAVLASAAMLTGQPGTSRVPVLTSGPVGTLHLLGTAGDSAIQVAVNLPQTGRQRYLVSVVDADSRTPRTDVQRVILRFHPPEGLGLPTAQAELGESGEPGVWGIAGTYTPAAGTWGLEVVVRRAGAGEATATFELPIEPPSHPVLLPPPDTGLAIPGPMATAWHLLPSGAAGWGLAAAVLVTAVALGLWRRRIAGAGAGALGALRVALGGAAVVIALLVGARTLVEAANQVPAEAAGLTNPVPASADSVRLGREIFVANCAACHGTDGTGSGPAGATGLPPLGELVPGLSDAGLSYRIASGLVGTRMPAFATTLSETERWHLVNYLRSAFAARQD